MSANNAFERAGLPILTESPRCPTLQCRCREVHSRRSRKGTGQLVIATHEPRRSEVHHLTRPIMTGSSAVAIQQIVRRMRSQLRWYQQSF